MLNVIFILMLVYCIPAAIIEYQQSKEIKSLRARLRAQCSYNSELQAALHTAQNVCDSWEEHSTIDLMFVVHNRLVVERDTLSAYEFNSNLKQMRRCASRIMRQELEPVDV